MPKVTHPMPDPHKHARLELLRQRIAHIENRPVLAPGAAALMADAQDNGGRLVLPGGLLHEVFADDMRDAGASLGFALDQARRLLTGTRKALVYFCLAPDGQEAGLPFAPGLVQSGIDLQSMILCRVTSLADLLWALEETMACPPVAGAVVEVRGDPRLLDFTVSRRLSLRARSGGASVFFLRYGTFRCASAAHLRWHIAPAPSGTAPFDDRAPGPARFRLTLEKGHLNPAFAGLQTGWLMEWTHNGFERIDPARKDHRPYAPQTHEALSGPSHAALGH